jgi:hypothetical protein
VRGEGGAQPIQATHEARFVGALRFFAAAEATLPWATLPLATFALATVPLLTTRHRWSRA